MDFSGDFGVNLRVQHTAWFRVTAVVMLAFCLLSHGRALVPGMCATLAAAKDGARADTCCSDVCALSETSRTATAVEATRDKHPDCAFCNLAKGIIQVQAYVYCEHPAPVVERAALEPAERIVNTEPRLASRPRDPPSMHLLS